MKFLPVLAVLLAAALAWSQPPVRTGSVERIKVHGRSLEGNLSGDPAERDVSIYLPPGYKLDRARRYPVLYMLHGFTDSDSKWFGLEKHWINLPAVLDKAFAAPGARETIVVMPNAFTRFQGSLYSSSATVGDWEEFIAAELVAHIDRAYRTIPRPGSRGLAGHSMGGYGAIRIGMKRPGVFSSLYMLSPCCMAPPNAQAGGPGMPRAESIKDPGEIAKADFFTKAMLASAAAWSPDPRNPPFFIALPSKEGKPQPGVAAKWAANAPLAMADQYVPALRRLKAIAFDSGAKDEPIASTTREFGALLTAYGIAHDLEIYEGDHVNRVAERIETKAIPFFSRHLQFEPEGRARTSRRARASR
jgi:enterochelin esterase-like enzyme